MDCMLELVKEDKIESIYAVENETDERGNELWSDVVTTLPWKLD